VQLKIVAYPPYRAGLGAEPMRLELPDGSTLGDVLRELARRDRAFTSYATANRDEWLWGQLLVHLCGELVRLDDRLSDGDSLELLPPIAGG
jgi:molybdopterin converting factor small subunit